MSPRVALLLLCCAAAPLARGQEALPPDTRVPPFVRAEQSRLVFPGGRAPFDSLYSRLRRLRRGEPLRVNILHIGGSHVQAGALTHELRTLFASLAPRAAGSRGLLFPWRAARSNAPSNYSLEPAGRWTSRTCLRGDTAVPLGMSGAAVVTDDSAASLRLTLLSGIERWAFTRVRVLGRSLGGARPYAVTPRGDTAHCDPRAAGPDFTLRLPRACSACRVAFEGLGRGGARFEVRGLVPENDKPGITYTECGVNGASLPSWLRCGLLGDELRRVCPPDLAILAVGVNDANTPPGRFDTEAFKANYRRLIARIRQARPGAALLFVTNNDCWLSAGRRRRAYNRNTPLVERAMTELAREYDGAVWNQYQVMGGFSSSSRWVAARLMNKDHIHFLRPGYELLADLLFGAFLDDMSRP